MSARAESRSHPYATRLEQAQDATIIAWATYQRATVFGDAAIQRAACNDYVRALHRWMDALDRALEDAREAHRAEGD